MSLPDRAPIELVTRSIAEPAGQGGRYAPWQFAALAGLLDARDRARQPLASISTSPSRGSGPRPAAWSTDDSAAEAERLGGRAAPRLRRPAKHATIATCSSVCLRPQVSARPPASGRGRPGRRPTTPSSPTCSLVDWKRLLARRSAARSSTRS